MGLEEFIRGSNYLLGVRLLHDCTLARVLDVKCNCPLSLKLLELNLS